MAGVLVHELKAKLEKKEMELVQAAEYGQQLLEENRKLLHELDSIRIDNDTLKQVYYIIDLFWM